MYTMYMKGFMHTHISFFLLLFYICTAVFGLLPLSTHHSNMSGCPYTIGESLCSMDVFEHIKAWKTYTLSILIDIYLFILYSILLSVVGVYSTTSPPLIQKFLYYKNSIKKPIVSFLKQQFKPGLLNPKPY